MANSFTATYSFTLPEVGADTNAWGGHLNGNFTTIDQQMLSRTLTSAQTMAGSLALPANGLNVGSGQLQVTGGNVTASGNVSATGNVAASGNVSGVNGTFTGTLGVTGASTITGNATVGGTFGSTGAATFSSTIAVTGAATFSSTLTASTAPTTGGHLTNKTYVDAQDTTTQGAAVGLAAPSGAVMAFAMNSAPTGWLSADGSAVSRSTYAALFAAIGTTFGSGDGSSTFNLPDLRGYFLRGAGTNGDGTAAGTFGEKVADDVKPHSHAITDPGHFHGISTSGSAGTAYATTGGATNVSNTRPTDTATTGITINNSTGAETRPKNIALLYCIKT